MAENSDRSPFADGEEQGAPVALLIIDMINDLEFDHGEALLIHALPAAKNIATLKKKARAHGVPVIYVNDNFGKWRSDFRKQVDRCLSEDVTGRPLVEILKPDDEDYFILKPRHSGFYATCLELLLEVLGARHLILTGISGNICVQITADDAHMRGFSISAPSDCIASQSVEENDRALRHLREVVGADISPSAEIDFAELLRGASREAAGKEGG